MLDAKFRKLAKDQLNIKSDLDRSRELVSKLEGELDVANARLAVARAAAKKAKGGK